MGTPAKISKTIAIWLIVQSGGVILTNVCNWRPFSRGAHAASWKKPNQGLIRRMLPLGRSIGSLAHLISVGLIAGWIIAVFFGVGLFFLMPGSAKLASDLSPGSGSFDASLRLMLSTSRADRLSSRPHPQPPQKMGDAVAKLNPNPRPAEATIAQPIDELPEPAPGLNRGQSLCGLATPGFPLSRERRAAAVARRQ
jgi:hypothetical protein